MDRDRHLHLILFIRLKIKMQEQEAIADGGKLVDHPCHRRLLLLCASQCHNSLLVLDRGDGVEGTRGSPG